MSDAFDEQLDEDAANRQANQPQDADGGAPFVDEHDGERQQEDRRRHDRHDGDGEVKSPKDDEGPGRLGRSGCRLCVDAGHPRLDVARKGGGVAGIDERNVDRLHVFAAGRRSGSRVRFSRSGRCSCTSRITAPSLRGIRRRLVHARHAELLDAAAVGRIAQAHDVAGGEMLAFRKLS